MSDGARRLTCYISPLTIRIVRLSSGAIRIIRIWVVTDGTFSLGVFPVRMQHQRDEQHQTIHHIHASFFRSLAILTRQVHRTVDLFLAFPYRADPSGSCRPRSLFFVWSSRIRIEWRFGCIFNSSIFPGGQIPSLTELTPSAVADRDRFQFYLLRRPKAM